MKPTKVKEAAESLWTKHGPAIFVGCLAVLLLLIVIFCWCWLKSRKYAEAKRLTSASSKVSIEERKDLLKKKQSVAERKLSQVSQPGQRSKDDLKEMILIPENEATPKVTVTMVQPESVMSPKSLDTTFEFDPDYMAVHEEELSLLTDLGILRFAIWYDKNSGMLTITIVAAEDVPVRDLSGYAYSKVVLKLSPLLDSEEEKRTHEVRADSYIKYGETFTFAIKPEDLSRQVLSLYLYERNHWSVREGIGQVVIELAHLHLKSGKEYVISKPLQPYDPIFGLHVNRGSIYLEIDYYSKSDTDQYELSVYICGLKLAEKPHGYTQNDRYFATVSLLDNRTNVIHKKNTNVVNMMDNPDFEQTATFVLDNGLDLISTITVKLKEQKKMRRNRFIGGASIKKTSTNWEDMLDVGSTRGWFLLYKKGKKGKE